MSIEDYLKRRENRFNTQGGAQSLENNSELVESIIQAVKKRISNDPEISIIHFEEAKYKVRQFALKWIEEEIDANHSALTISLTDKYRLFDILVQNMFGFGVIEPILMEEEVTEIMINGCQRIFTERKGKLEEPLDAYGNKVNFTNENELKTIIDKIVAPLNRKVDESNPIVDARLPDGSRVNVVLSPISLNGTAMTIRRFPEQPYTMNELVEKGTLSQEHADLLKILVQSKYNILISGGTGSGKTTFLNALSMFIPDDERVITIEDSAELKFNQVKNLIRLETRTANIEGEGEIDIRALVKTSLRMRPDRIVVGEVRGGEALDMLQAMNTGHDGSLTTGHANSAEDMLLRLETMVLMAGVELPLESVKRQIASGIDLIVHIGKLRDKSRKVLEIIEIRGMKNKEIEIATLYQFKEQNFDHVNNKINGQLVKTDETLKNRIKLASSGMNEKFIG